MDDSFSTVSKHIKQRAVIEFLTHEKETPIEIHRRLLAFYGEEAVDISTVRRWLIKSRDTGRNVDVNDQPRSESPVTASHYVNRQKVDELIQKIEELRREP
jgi:hypothetical protein